MATVTIPEIVKQLRQLPTDKLADVFDFVSTLLDQEDAQTIQENKLEVYQVLMASEKLLSKDWDLPIEDEAWQNL
jgi:hypothetical protein